MITKETAQNICDACEAIRDCQRALSNFQGECKPETSSLNVANDNEDEGITIFLTAEVAKEALEKQLAIHEAQYKSFNDDAIKEAGRE